MRCISDTPNASFMGGKTISKKKIQITLCVTFKSSDGLVHLVTPLAPPGGSGGEGSTHWNRRDERLIKYMGRPLF